MKRRQEKTWKEVIRCRQEKGRDEKKWGEDNKLETRRDETMHW